MPSTSQPTPPVSQPESGSGSTQTDPPHVPVLDLDREATIQELNEPARRALEYPPEASISSCFFSHVHGHNLRRVMRDLAYMVSHRKQRSQWLLRLRTGNGRWRWYRVLAKNHLDTAEGSIRVRLRPL